MWAVLIVAKLAVRVLDDSCCTRGRGHVNMRREHTVTIMFISRNDRTNDNRLLRQRLAANESHWFADIPVLDSAAPDDTVWHLNKNSPVGNTPRFRHGI